MGGPFATMEGFLSKLKMTALRTQPMALIDPVLGAQNPPLLRLKLSDEQNTRGTINCFVQSENSCRVERDPEHRDELSVLAEKPLTGRRNKYTLTVLGRDGRWQWHSQLWINAKQPVSKE